jgi:hypothetical protein
VLAKYKNVYAYIQNENYYASFIRKYYGHTTKTRNPLIDLEL